MRFISLAFLLFMSCTHNVGARDYIKNQQLIIPEKDSIMRMDFSELENLDSWRITDDGVMGGKSKGRFLLKKNQGLFTGDISLDNNGGFSSVFRKLEPLSSDLETVTIDVQGDGLTYQLRIIVNLDGYRLAYKHNFNTVAGQRQKLTFTLTDFQASFRGRILTDVPLLQSEDIRQVGFLVTRKRAGKFSLQVISLFFK
jgi:hypothetical protein